MTKKKDKQRTFFILCFLIPPLVLFALLYIWPFIYAFIISLFSWSGYSQDMTFSSLANFKQAFPTRWSVRLCCITCSCWCGTRRSH